jgi:cytochrome c oxidase assembly protein subunit 15
VTRRLSQVLLWVAFVLALVVVGASSGLRLAANGLGCEPWPGCYGTDAATQQAQQATATQAARRVHRAAASAFALAAIGAIGLGWRQWPRRARVAALLLVAVTAALSAIGLYTPSPLPAVTLANVLGGLALLCVVAFTLATPAALPRRGTVALAALAAIVALQAASGAMISVRAAGAACEQGCGAQWGPGTLRLWDPLQPGAADRLVARPRSGEALHALHRLGAILLAVAAVTAAAMAATRSRALLAAFALCAVLGVLANASTGSLVLAVAHALGAGLLIAAVGAALGGAATAATRSAP